MDVGQDWKGSSRTVRAFKDPVTWQEQQLGIEVFSNQIDITKAIRDPLATNINILGARGSGKSIGLSDAFAELLSNSLNQHIISTAPIMPQATRLLRFVSEAMKSKTSKVKDLVDWQASGAQRLIWKNGNTMVAVSGQERASTEGEHGNIIAMDEAHLVPGHSVSSKLMPMLSGINVSQKVIKLGVAMGRGHFFRSFNAKGARNCVCPWNKAEIHLMETNPLFYKGLQVSRKLHGMMPREYKMKYFPDRPDLQELTGAEISILDWQTQYELEWVDDILNFLSEEEHKALGEGTHSFLTRGKAGDRYFAGLDTAHAWSGRGDTDWTVLSIWRLNRNGTVDKVASYRWRNKLNDQREEIEDIIHPKKGLFRCEATFVDGSNVGGEIVAMLRKKNLAIAGVMFGGSAKPATGNSKNWKNTLYDNFIIHLQNNELRFPGIQSMKNRFENATSDEKTQIENILDDYFEWGVIQRIRGRGINDEIMAPTDKVEDDNNPGSMSQAVHDDGPTADVLAVYAALHPELMKKMMSGAGALGGYEIPDAVVGSSTSSTFAPGSAASAASAAGGENPAAMADRQKQRETMGQELTHDGSSMGSPIMDYLNANDPNMRKK